MKKTNIFLIIFCLASAQLAAQSSDEKEVAAAVENLRKAMVDGSKSALENIAADEISYGHSSGLVEDKATFVEAIASGKTDFVAITLNDQTIRIVDKIAIVRHKLKADINREGTTVPLDISVLTIWKKQKEGWKLLARQGIKLP